MNISEEQSRTAMLLGADALERLKSAHVAVFGIGGVGSYVCEGLARAGVGAIDLFDSDTVSRSNINRQLVALHSTIGLPKVEVMRNRILDINPDCRVTAHNVFYLPENADGYPLDGYDYIADAIDTVSAKIELTGDGDEGFITLVEGKYHQIKRMLEALDNKITYLERVTFGPLELDVSLARGEWRYLTEAEIQALEEGKK